MSTVKTSWVL